jgi:hypothetical protein
MSANTNTTELEGGGKGRKYIDLAKFLLDCRKGKKAEFIPLSDLRNNSPTQLNSYLKTTFDLSFSFFLRLFNINSRPQRLGKP